ncbi:MAG: lysophospholipase [Pseudomonadota bacterium]
MEAQYDPPWRHWQPGGRVAKHDQDTDMSAPPAAAGVVLALHGFNDYSNAFQDFAAYCSERGIAVHAYDQRGFGANQHRGYWPGMDRLTADLHNAVARLRRIYGDTPIYVLGESMGGAVAIVAATDGRPLDVEGVILSAPAVWGGEHMNLFYRLTLWFASTFAPGWALTSSGLDIQPSDNIEMLRAFSADPLVIKATRTSSIAGLVALMDRALASAPKLDKDLLLLVGEKDEIVPAGAFEDFRDRLQTENATEISYPDGYHMLLRDLQRSAVFEDIVAWIGDPSDRGELALLKGENRP